MFSGLFKNSVIVRTISRGLQDLPLHSDDILSINLPQV